MKRFLALGVGMAVSVAAVAGDPVSVNPPGSSLSRPLPSVVQDAAATPAPAPALVSTPPRWSATGAVQPSSGAVPTHYGPTSFTPPPAGCDTCGPTTRPHFNLLSPGLLPRPAAGCGPRGTLLDRLKTWLGFHPCPSGVPLCTPRPFYAPIRWYFPYTANKYGCGTNACDTGGCATGNCPHPAGGRITERGRLFAGRAAGDVGIPYTPAAADCGGGNCRPRVLYVPLGGQASRSGECDNTGAARPGLFRRLMARLGLCDDADYGYGCSSGNCPPPAPSPVHYASPCVSPPAPQPAGMLHPPIDPSTPRPWVVPQQTPPAAPAKPDGKISTRTASPTQAFTNP